MSEIASRRRILLQGIFDHALSVGAAALGVALLVATAWHLLRPAVPPTPQLATISPFTNGGAQRPRVATGIGVNASRHAAIRPLGATLAQHNPKVRPVHFSPARSSPARSSPSRTSPNRLWANRAAPNREAPKRSFARPPHTVVRPATGVVPPSTAAANAPRPIARHAATGPHSAMAAHSIAVRHAALVAGGPGFAAHPAAVVRPIHHSAPPVVRLPIAPQSVPRRPRTIAASHAPKTVAFVRKLKSHPRYRHRYGRFVAPLNYNPLPALSTVQAQAPAVDLAPDSLPTPCTNRRHCR